MAEQNNILGDKFVQVPVINKTGSLFRRDPVNPKVVVHEANQEIVDLMQKEPYIFTVKTDGTCGMIVSTETGRFTLMRRQDVKVTNRNYQMVMDNGTLQTVAGVNCFVTKMVRGTQKSSIEVPLYIFQLGPDMKPEPENDTHIIGFTPLLENFGDDKYAITAIKKQDVVSINGAPGMMLYTTIFDGSLDIRVEPIPVEEIMGDKLLMTVEIMGSKISNKYGFTNDTHFINPHGSIYYPTAAPEDGSTGKSEQSDLAPPLDYAGLKEWFENDHNNRWANVEGFVIHFPLSAKRFKIHRGHVGLEHTWVSKKSSGINFIISG